MHKLGLIRLCFSVCVQENSAQKKFHSQLLQESFDYTSESVEKVNLPAPSISKMPHAVTDSSLWS